MSTVLGPCARRVRRHTDVIRRRLRLEWEHFLQTSTEPSSGLFEESRRVVIIRAPSSRSVKMIRHTVRSFATSARRMAATPHMGIAQAQGIAKGLTGGIMNPPFPPPKHPNLGHIVTNWHTSGDTNQGP